VFYNTTAPNSGYTPLKRRIAAARCTKSIAAINLYGGHHE